MLEQETDHIFESLSRVAEKIDQIPDSLKYDIKLILRYLWEAEKEDYEMVNDIDPNQGGN